MIDPIALTQSLITRASVTPDDAGCQDLLQTFLEPMGFVCERFRFGEVDNLWARLGTAEPLFVFLGHTDVVPTGPLSEWNTDPFKPTIENGKLFGRGTSDMKASIASFISACERFLKHHPSFKGSIGFLVTSDEEGPSLDGVQKVLPELIKKNHHIKYCVTGEPTSEKLLGDIIKVGRRGSLTGHLKIAGIQGHIAYPDKALNPIHAAATAIKVLTETKWDDGNSDFQPSSFQISNIHSGTGAQNVIPGELKIDFNFRYSVCVTADDLKKRVEEILDAHDLRYTIDWVHGGLPFLTTSGKLRESAIQVVKKIMGVTPVCSTVGGTSDARFVAPLGAEVIELGPRTTAHQINEFVYVDDIVELSKIYEALMVDLLG